MGKQYFADINGTEEFYSGITAGSSHGHRGNGANHLCLVKDPQYTLRYSVSGPSAQSYIYGTEYEHPIVGTQNHNVPCAVCHVTTRSAVLMIPGCSGPRPSHSHSQQVNEPLPPMTSALHKPSSIITYRNSNKLPAAFNYTLRHSPSCSFPCTYSILNLPHTNPLFTLVLVTPFMYSCNVVLSSIITVVKVKVIFSLS